LRGERDDVSSGGRLGEAVAVALRDDDVGEVEEPVAVAVAVVLGMIWSNPVGGRLLLTARLRRS
jgi:hypothetical protein